MPTNDDSQTTRKPDDVDILKRWNHMVRVYHRGGGFAQRIALALADRLQAEGVTEQDIDRVVKGQSS